MLCSTCHEISQAGGRHCEHCGSLLTIACTHCGSLAGRLAKFCTDCGHALVGGPAAAELKQVTVLFADVVGSTELVAGLDAEQAMQLLGPAVDTMVQIVRRHHGSIGRTLGDGIMAFFGAPRAHEGHALLACQAALALHAEAAQAAPPMKLRIGLHSGEVVADLQAREPATGREMHGLTIHLASRIVAVAEPGTTALSGDCYRLARTHYDATTLGARALKGITEPVPIYRLAGPRSAAPGEAFYGIHLATLRGRERELALLQQALADAQEGRARIIGIAGAPGAGKSRLCYEFTRWCRGRLIPVFEARAQLYGHATPLQPVLEFLRSLFFRISPNDDAAVARERIATRMAQVDHGFEADLPLLYEFLGVPQEHASPVSYNPATRREHLLDVVRHLVRGSGAETSLIVIEDLHWFDEASDQFIDTLAAAVAGTKTMLVVNYRPSYRAPWQQLPGFQEIVLDELEPQETAQLVHELIGTRPETRDIAELVKNRSGGNPFFAEELIRSLVAGGVLVGDSGQYTLGRPATEDLLPATVQAVIGARIDRLPDALKRILQIGSIIGKDIPLAVLERIVEIPAGTLQTSLAQLCEAEFLQEQPSRDDRRYLFRHPLMQEVAYLTQLKLRRRPLHAQVARAIEAVYGHRGDEFAGLLAHHYEAAGERLQAAESSARAAGWIGATDSAQAVKHWRKVNHLMTGLPRSPGHDRLRITAHGQVAWLGWRDGLTVDGARPFLTEALRWAREGDDDMVPLLLFVEGRIDVASGGPADRYVARVREALQLPRRSGEGLAEATLQAALSHAYGWAGLLGEALEASDAALAAGATVKPFDQRFLGYSVEHWTLNLRGRILARMGRDEAARECLDAMLALDRIDPTVRIIAHIGYIDIAWSRRDAALALQHAARVMQIAGEHPSAYLRVFSHASMGLARSVSGEFALAIDEYRRGLDVLRQTRAAMESEAEMLANLAQGYERIGDHAAAIATARDAIALCRERAARLPLCRSLLTLGSAQLAASACSAAEAATALFDEAEALIRQTGAVVYTSLLDEARGRLCGVAPCPH